MAGTITLALRTAQSGLLTNQSALDAVANNIANVNSPGYSRKIVNMEQRVVGGNGAGVQISEITRTIDEGLLKSLRLELTALNSLNVQTSFYERMQEVFGSPGDDRSLSHIVNELTNALESLADSPDKSLEQSEVVRWGNEVALKLQSMTKTVQELRLQADNAIANSVTEINNLITRIGDLNDKIVRNSAISQDTSDLRDQRDQALDELAELVDIVIFNRGDGDVVVFTSAGTTLVDNIPATLTHAGASAVSSTTTHAEGDFAAIAATGAVNVTDLTANIRGGKLKGLIDLRDEILTNLQSQIDEFAAEMRDITNRVHNRGIPFPGLGTVTGSRIFTAVDTGNTATVSADVTTSADVVVGIFDSDGNQVDTTTLTAGTYFVNDGTVASVVGFLNNFLVNGSTGAGSYGTATVNSDGKVALTMTSGFHIGFADQATTTDGDVTVSYDYTDDGVVDETVLGFANFLGLNDFFQDGLRDNLWESDVVATSFAATNAATLTFRDSSGVLTGSPLAISAGDTLSTIATNITNNVTNVTATVIPDGDGSRLRISHDAGLDLVMSQAAGNTLLTETNMHVGDVRVASSLAVRSDIKTTPSKLSRGSVQFDSGRGIAGEYFTSVADDTIAQQLAEQFTTTVAFEQAGGLPGSTIALAEYAAMILGRNSSLADANETEVESQKALTDSLQFKSDSIRGVNLDEEMATLLLFEQAFSASARVITVIRDMFDALERAV